MEKRAAIDKEIAAIMHLNDDAEVEPLRQSKVKKVRHCTYCGKTGHTSRKCPKFEGGELKKSVEKKHRVLDPIEFGMIQDRKTDGFSSLEVSQELEIDIADVNGAWMFTTYEHYKKAKH